MKNFKTKLLFSVLFFSIVSFNLVVGQNLGYCPKDSEEDCRYSLSSALNIVTNCALNRPRVKKCALILIQTLSEADHKAPFCAQLYEKDFEIGDVGNYKKQVEDLKNYSVNAWIALHNLSKALILSYIDIKTLTKEQKRQIENLINPIFELDEGRQFNVYDPHHRNVFIEKQINRAKAIEWGDSKEKRVLS